MKKKIIFVALIFLLLVGLYWFFTHSYIEITPGANDTTNTSYTITEVGSQKQTYFTSNKPIKKLVKKGQYEVLAQNGETSYFASAGTKGFLSKSTVFVKLEQEKSRKFVGDNPGACMFNIGQSLASVDCGDLFSQLKLHVPATSKQPTYTRTSTELIDGIIEGSATTNQGTILLLRSSAGTNHTAYLLSSDLKLGNKVLLSELDSENAYYIQPYKDGFVIYDGGYSKILYYSSLGSKSEAITIKAPDDKKLTPGALYAQGNTIITSYSNDLSNDVHESGNDKDPKKPKSSKKVTTVLSINTDNATKQYKFSKPIFSARLCGTSKLCILSNEKLEVYDITGSKPRFVFSVGGVNRIDIVKNTLLAVKNNAVIGLDVDKQSGSIQYSFGEYQYCGYANNITYYTVCITTDNQKSSALFIDPSTSNNGSIDKKILPLLDLPDVKSLSVYDKYIFVSPDLGEVVFNEASGSFGYDAATKTYVNKKINQAFDNSGIDKNAYQLINPFK